MKLEQLKREISLNKLGITGMSMKASKILDFLEDNLMGLNKYTHVSDSRYICFGKEKDKLILEYDKERNTLSIDYEIWSFFDLELSIEYIHIKSILRWYIVNAHKIDVDEESVMPTQLLYRHTFRDTLYLDMP